MAFNTSTPSNRKSEEYTFRSNPSSSVQDTTFSSYNSLSYDAPSISSTPSHGGRTTLHRRFTSEVMTPTPKEAISHSRYVAGDMSGLDAEADQRLQDFARKRDEQRALQDAIQRLTIQSHQNEQDMRRMKEDLKKDTIPTTYKAIPGFIDPSTPPDGAIQDHLPSNIKLSSGSILDTPSPALHQGSVQQLMTPPAEDVLAMKTMTSVKSSSSSRRNSEEEGNSTTFKQPSGSAGNLRTLLSGLDNHSASPQSAGLIHNGVLGSVSSHPTSFIFPSEHNETINVLKTASPPDVKGYLQVNSTDDNFPILVRRDSYPTRLSSNVNAFDLSRPQIIGNVENQTTWPTFARQHRPAQHSLPMNTYNRTHTGTLSPKLGANNIPTATLPHFDPGPPDVFGGFVDQSGLKSVGQYSVHADMMSNNVPANIPRKLQSSFSATELPTLRTLNTTTRAGFDHSRNPSAEYSTGVSAIFGPPIFNSMTSLPVTSLPGMSPLQSPSLYNQYVTREASSGYVHPSYTPFLSQTQLAKANEPQINPHNSSRSGHHKRNSETEGNRFANVSLDSLVPEIHQLCKDQHGCRFLQKKLEEKNPQHVQLIFEQTHAHVVELMTDPFGNYLCQKLLEYANDEQRTVLVNTAAPHLVDIALNQHGTRALQKMIEFISTPEQINTIVNALESKVVQLISDLNGNHVIQKCLNRLSPKDAQFIFDAVGKNCVRVGTHRHGCCVLQRCIDHASEDQKIELIGHVTNNAFTLVQDAYGNYVVQYILDLGDSKLSDTLIRQFLGHVREFSKEKFSSNVIEKCIRVAETETKNALIEEMMEDPAELDKLVRDNYANYVVQTALEYAEPGVKERLVGKIRPFLPAIRSTPFGRRIIHKLQPNEANPAAGNHILLGSATHITYNHAYRPGNDSFITQSQPRTMPPMANNQNPMLRGHAMQPQLGYRSPGYRSPFQTGLISPSQAYF